MPVVDWVFRAASAAAGRSSSAAWTERSDMPRFLLEGLSRRHEELLYEESCSRFCNSSDLQLTALVMACHGSV